jgi:hypothetical protein
VEGANEFEGSDRRATVPGGVFSNANRKLVLLRLNIAGLGLIPQRLIYRFQGYARQRKDHDSQDGKADYLYLEGRSRQRHNAVTPYLGPILYFNQAVCQWRRCRLWVVGNTNPEWVGRVS